MLVVAAVCVRLGFWQLERLAQRRALSTLAAERMARPAIDIDRVPGDSADAVWLRARLSGGCEGAQFVLAGRSRHGAPGVHLLCRFRTDGGRAILLDRGWLPSADARSVSPEVYARAPRDTSMVALLVPFPPGRASARSGTTPRLSEADGGVALGPAEPRVIYRLNRAQASAATGIDLPGWYAQALGPADRPPIPADPPDPGAGPHLGYAVQWFSFAAIALIGWLVLVLDPRHRRGAPALRAPRAGSRDETHP
ncbi:MAG TPA: SURF1 family protein [Longimicrobiales bacterium]|nr:SURF1 family protein [Longimicrobiales bacterium]